jgi:hypothetical protein
MAKKDSSLAGVRSMAKRFVHPFRITKGKGFRLKDVDPRDTRGLDWNDGARSQLLLHSHPGILSCGDATSFLRAVLVNGCHHR